MTSLFNELENHRLGNNSNPGIFSKGLIENVIICIGQEVKSNLLKGIPVAVSTLSMQILNPQYHFSLNETSAPCRSD